MPSLLDGYSAERSAALSARRLARHGLRTGAYDGGNGRRFCLFESGFHNGEAVEWRREFSTKRDRDAMTLARLAELSAQ